MNFNEQTVLRRTTEVDQGLRSYMIKVYSYMGLGLTVSGIIAYFSSTYPPLMKAIFQTPLYWVVLMAPILMVIFLGSAIAKMSTKTAIGVFVGYAAATGLSLSSIFFIYTHDSIFSAFGVSAALFLGMGIYGYATKKDLTSIGSFLMMGVLGLVLAMLVNIFMRNSALDFALSIIAVIIFTGLTAYDAQKIRLSYDENDYSSTLAKKAILGALTLYLDFINLFLHMLRFLGKRK